MRLDSDQVDSTLSYKNSLYLHTHTPKSSTRTQVNLCTSQLAPRSTLPSLPPHLPLLSLPTNLLTYLPHSLYYITLPTSLHPSLSIHTLSSYHPLYTTPYLPPYTTSLLTSLHYHPTSPSFHYLPIYLPTHLPPSLPTLHYTTYLPVPIHFLQTTLSTLPTSLLPTQPASFTPYTTLPILPPSLSTYLPTLPPSLPTLPTSLPTLHYLTTSLSSESLHSLPTSFHPYTTYLPPSYTTSIATSLPHSNKRSLAKTVQKMIKIENPCKQFRQQSR